ncbi:hypothetical protein Tco_0357222 [Tanacetum coccineum]
MVLHSPVIICEPKPAVVCVQWYPDKSSVFGSSTEDGGVNIRDYETMKQYTKLNLMLFGVGRLLGNLCSTRSQGHELYQEQSSEGSHNSSQKPKKSAKRELFTDVHNTQVLLQQMCPSLSITFDPQRYESKPSMEEIRMAIVMSAAVTSIGDLKLNDVNKTIEARVYRKWIAKSVSPLKPTGFCCMLLDREV